MMYESVLAALSTVLWLATACSEPKEEPVCFGRANCTGDGDYGSGSGDGSRGGDDEGGGVGDGQSKSALAACDVLITEFLPEPGNPVAGRRWVEILNASEAVVEVGALMLCTINKGTATAGEKCSGLQECGDMLLAPGQYAWIRIDALPLPEGSASGLAVCNITKNLTMPDSNFEISIQTLDGAKVHSLTVGTKGTECAEGAPVIPASLVKTNHSVELAPEHMSCLDSTGVCGAWQTSEATPVPGDSEAFGTPGASPQSPAIENPECEDVVVDPDGVVTEATSVDARVPGPGDLVPTELMVDGSTDCSGKKDWVEVLNLTGDVLTLTGCTVKDETTEPKEVKNPVTIEPGEYIVLLQSSDPSVFKSGEAFPFGGTPNLNQDGDWFTLECDGKVVFEIKYGKSGPVPAPQDLKDDGSSDARVAVQLKPGAAPITAEFAQDPAGWEHACKPLPCGDLASPGAANPTCAE